MPRYFETRVWMINCCLQTTRRIRIGKYIDCEHSFVKRPRFYKSSIFE
jgi:hypothetical protein